ncbi:MAG: hydrogenase maturation protease [Candidatus Eisenbacteria bacterium]|nr:hydrogenase maturation protease [Candidatus Eisenbacteria bacterium]
MENETGDVLLIGYGNPGRLDDGLGPALAREIEKLDIPGVNVDADYQLNVEDAAEAARHHTVVFADADTGGPEPFWLKRIEPAGSGVSFSSHSVDPRAILALARDLFGAEPEAFLLGIRGYEFNGFGEGLSERAEANLAAAAKHLEEALRRGAIEEIRPEGWDHSRLRTGTESEDDR